MKGNLKDNFIENLPKIYGMYTGGFLVFILLMAVFEQMGMQADTIGILFVAFTVFIYAAIGWLSRTMQVDTYYVAGRQVPTVFNGMATAADWMSGASFVAMAGRYLLRRAWLSGVRGLLDRRLRTGRRIDGALPAQVRLLYGTGFHRYALWW